jgi:hypothetical protein
MREGFAGTVAVPAWARFMRAATKGARPEWYRMPADVEKVAICRISGMRAGPDCHAASPVTPDPAPQSNAFTGTTDTVNGVVPLLPAIPAVPLPPAEPTVYEDLFPTGAVPPEICQLHDPAARVVTTSTTPLVDAAMQPAAFTPSSVRAPAPEPHQRFYVERVPRPDGSFTFVIRERR